MRSGGQRRWCGRLGHGRAAGKGSQRHQSQILPIELEQELRVALGAVRLGWFDLAAAAVADAQEVCDAGHAFGGGPELMRRGASEDRVKGDASTGDEGDDGFVGATGLKGCFGVADEPGAHRVLRSLAGEGIEKPATVDAARLIGGRAAAVGADEHRRCGERRGCGLGRGLHRRRGSIRMPEGGGCVGKVGKL